MGLGRDPSVVCAGIFPFQPPLAGLLHAAWLELPSRPINKEVFQDELAITAIQWTAAMVAWRNVGCTEATRCFWGGR
jgi:hypothetical protein